MNGLPAEIKLSQLLGTDNIPSFIFDIASCFASTFSPGDFVHRAVFLVLKTRNN